MYIGIEVIPILFCRFNTTSLILLVKTTSIRNSKSVKSWWKVTNSGGLMFVCGCASVNNLVQNKFYSVRQFMYWASIYLLKVTDGNTRWICETCWKLTLMTPEQCHLCRSAIFTVNLKHISRLALLFLVFLSLTLNR